MKISSIKDSAAKKKAAIVRGVKSFVVLLLAGFLLLTGMTFADYKEASLTEVSLSGIRELTMINNEVEAVQSFHAKYPKLNHLYVYFANEHEGKVAGEIHFTIIDSKGNKVAKTNVKAASIPNKAFTKVPMDVELTMFQKYYLIVSGENLPAGSAPILYKEKASLGTGVYLDGNTHRGKMEVRYFYPLEAHVQKIVLMAAIAGLMALVFVDFKKFYDNKRAAWILAGAEKVLFLATPLVAFYMVEHFTYNSIGNIYVAGTVMNIVLYYILYFAGYMITNNRRANVIGCLLISYILGAANYFVLTFRGNPILPTDILSFTTAMNVAENYTYTLNSAFFSNGILLLFTAIMYCKMRCGNKLGRRGRIFVLGTVLTAAIAVTALIKEETFLNKHNVKADIWNQKRGYSYDGALASFCVNAKYLYAKKPAGYSVDRVMEIAESYIWNEKETASLKGMSSRKKNSSSAKKKNGKKPNIIMIMNEAFSDLEVIRDIPTNKEYMPFFNSLSENTIRGNLFVSIFGSGTCNSEFEVLTGNTVAFLPSGSIGYTQFVKDEMPNVTQVLKEQDYKGNIALHPYLSDGWNRESVYPWFGFEQFLSQDDFDNPEMIRKYISDQENYDKIKELYEENKKNNAEDPFYLFTVTMQNHGGYSKDYGNFENEIEITDESLKDAQAEQYLSLIKQSDRAFKNLVNYFEEQDEPTMIVMFGDHQPSIRDEFYQKLYGKDLNDLTIEELQKKFQVPFLIWTNYDIEEQEIDALSANYLGAYVLKAAGLSMTPYQRYLYDLSKKVPVINAAGYIGDDGVYYSHGEESPYTDYISNYRILQYNNVNDYKNRYDSFFGADNLVD